MARVGARPGRALCRVPVPPLASIPPLSSGERGKRVEATDDQRADHEWVQGPGPARRAAPGRLRGDLRPARHPRVPPRSAPRRHPRAHPRRGAPRRLGRLHAALGLRRHQGGRDPGGGQGPLRARAPGRRLLLRRAAPRATSASSWRGSRKRRSTSASPAIPRAAGRCSAATAPRDRRLQHLLRGAEPLAGRARRGVGVGWVSILKTARLREILGIPPHVIPVAYLCLGYVAAFPARPTLAVQGWRQRLALAEVIAFEGWGRREDPGWDGLGRAVAAGGAEPGAARDGAPAGYDRGDRAARRGGDGGGRRPPGHAHQAGRQPRAVGRTGRATGRDHRPARGPRSTGRRSS